MNTGVRDGKFYPIAAKGLWKDKDQLCYWRKIKVTRYFPRSEKYEGFWESTNEKTRLPRIFVLFEVRYVE